MSLRFPAFAAVLLTGAAVFAQSDARQVATVLSEEIHSPSVSLHQMKQYLLPRVGALVTFAAQPLGRVLLLVLPLVLLAADSARKRLATRSRGQRLLVAARRARAAGYVELAVTAARGVSR